MTIFGDSNAGMQASELLPIFEDSDGHVKCHLLRLRFTHSD
jgi:hypothetical protein